MPTSTAEVWLEDVRLPGHSGRPDMPLSDRQWLADRRNRQTVARLWDRLREAPRTITGNYGSLTSEWLEDAGVPEWLVAHWRSIDYTATGERIEMIPGGMIARDLGRLGLGFADVQAGTAITPQPRPRPTRRHRPAEPAVIGRRAAEGTATLTIRRRGEVARAS